MADNEGARAVGIDKMDKLYELRPLINAISEACENHKYPNQAVSIDESMIGTKCKIGFLQYLPKKPTKWGVKVWVLADAKSGYVHKFQIYTGKEESPNSSYGLGYRVVMDLLQDYLGKGHILYCDNFYTSALLAMDLRKRETFLCGTVRLNSKNLPDEIKPDVFILDKESCVFRKSGELTCVRWKEKKRDVFLLSTKYRNEMTTVRRKGEGGQARTIDAPMIVDDYNKNMGGVDVGDQLLVYYALGRKTLKWWRHVFWRLIELGIVNAYLLYREVILCNSLTERKKGSHKRFRIALCHALVTPFLEDKAQPDALIVRPRGGRPSTRGIERLHGKHFGKKTTKRNRCVCCSMRPRRDGTYGNKRPFWGCPTCEVNLCKSPCFQIYHTRYDYWKYAPKS